MKGQRFYLAFLNCLVVIVMITVSVAAQSKKDRDQAKKLQDQADKAIGAKNYKEAADLYGQSVALVPNNAYAHYRKGFAHFSLKENDQAISEFTLALTQGFKPLEIYRIRYYIYFEQNNYDAALSDIQKGLQLAPNDLNFLTAVGEINYARKSYPEALAAFQKAAQVAPDNADLQYNLARVNFAIGDAKAQASAAESALAKGTRFPGESFYLLGDANQKLKNTAGAIEAYQKALNVKPNIYQAYHNLAELFRGENRFTDAINISKQGLIQFPSDGTFYSELGLYYSLAGRPEDAVQASKAGIQLSPNQPIGYTNLCRAYNETGKYDLAVSACNSSLRLRPDDGETNFYLGNALVGQGKGVEATRAYINAVRGLVDYTSKNPNQSDGWYLLGNAYFADKQFDKAVEAYLKCLNISPKFLKARVNLGITYTRKKNKAAATEQYNLLLAVDASLAARVKAEIDKM